MSPAQPTTLTTGRGTGRRGRPVGTTSRGASSQMYQRAWKGGPLGAASAPAGRARGNGAEPGDPSARLCFPEQGHWKRPASPAGGGNCMGGASLWMRSPHENQAEAKETPAARHPWGAAWVRSRAEAPCVWDPSAGGPSFLPSDRRSPCNRGARSRHVPTAERNHAVRPSGIRMGTSAVGGRHP